MSAPPPDDDVTGFDPTMSYPPAAAPATPAVQPKSVDTGNALPAGTYLGEFELLSVVGEGGFGIVYRAWDHSLKRQVAVKEYMPSSLAQRTSGMQVTVRSEKYNETFIAGLQSFVKEARMLAQFDHPALVKVFRFWEANGSAYMVMPFYDGVTLRDELRQRGAAPDEATLLGWLGPIADALAIIHAEYWFHRDIAPDNVLLLAGSRRPVLLDFGAARRVIGDMTQALTVILKPGYAPVEQYAEIPGMKQGPWTDVYALSALAYYAIRGKTPPPSVGRLVNDSFEPISRVAAGRYSERVLAAIDHGLAVRPDNRTQSVAAFKAELGLPPPPVDTQGLDFMAPAPPRADGLDLDLPVAPAAPPVDDDRTQVLPGSDRTELMTGGVRTELMPAPPVNTRTEVLPPGSMERTQVVARTAAVPPAMSPEMTQLHMPVPQTAVTQRQPGPGAAPGGAPMSGTAAGGAPTPGPVTAMASPSPAAAPEAAPAPFITPAVASPAPAVAPAPAPAEGGRRGLLIGLGALAAVGAGGGLWWSGRSASGPAPAASPSPAMATAAPPAAVPAPPAPPPVFDALAAFNRIVAAQSAGWGLELTTPSTKLRMDKDLLFFTIRSLQDGHVYAFYQGSDGTLQQLYPNGMTAAPRAAKGRAVKLPQGGLDLNVAGPPGQSHLLVMVSRWPRNMAGFSPKVDGGFTSFPTGTVAGALEAANTGRLPLIAGQPVCPANEASCSDEFGAALLAIEVIA